MKNKLIRRKKADIPVMILVIGIIAICSLTLLSFFITESRIVGFFSGIKNMQELSSGIDQYQFYKNAGISDENISNKLRIIQDSNGQRYLYIEENSTIIEPGLDFDWSVKKTIFYAKYILP